YATRRPKRLAARKNRAAPLGMTEMKPKVRDGRPPTKRRAGAGMKGNGSLVAEGDDGVDAECPARRKIAGSRDDGGEEKRRERMGRGMGRAYAVELFRDSAGETGSA